MALVDGETINYCVPTCCSIIYIYIDIYLFSFELFVIIECLHMLRFQSIMFHLMIADQKEVRLIIEVITLNMLKNDTLEYLYLSGDNGKGL